MVLKTISYLYPMKYYVGQKVSLLHESGEGEVIAIIDKQHVEVDLGDDFPIDLHVDEIIAVDPGEDRFFNKKKGKVEKEEPEASAIPLGIHLFELSLAITEDSETHYKFTLINPEPKDFIYVFYTKIKHKYVCVANGKVRSGGKDFLGLVSKQDVSQTRSLYFQLFKFSEGPGVPEQPIISELSWGKIRMASTPKKIAPLGTVGWLFPVQEIQTEPESLPSSDFITTKDVTPIPISSRTVDLHIEKLVTNPHELGSSEMLRIQLEHFEKSLSDAIMDNVEKLIVIHGVGEGKLRGEVRQILKASDETKQFSAADPVKYGNGATEVMLGK